MYFEIFDIDDPVLDRKLVNRHVLIIKKGTSERAVENSKLTLFKLMKKVVIKNVKNYVNLAYNSPVTERCLDEDEMYAESFIVMMKCVKNFSVKKGNCFYFYFNKSLSRNFYRMFDKEIRKLDNHKKYETQIKHVNSSYDVYKDDIYSIEFVTESLQLDDFDRRVLKSKLLFEKKDDFIVNNKDATVSRYYSSIRKIKSQLQILKDDGDI